MSAEKLPASSLPGPDRAGADLRRAQLTTHGVSRDGDRLLLVNDEGVEFTVEIDARLRSALGGHQDADVRPPGRMEKTMDKTSDSALRPRDIQARIRAGETPESVAEVAQTSVDKIMPYAGPVLAEREHVAERAQKASVRRRAGESARGSRTLGDAVAAHLRGRNVDPSAVTWDAWRREDGRWVVTGGFDTAERAGTARLTFDSPGNFVTLEDDDARWLLGELAEEASLDQAVELVSDPAPETEESDLERARRRRAAAPEPDPHQDELPLGDDAPGLVVDTQPESEPALEHEHITEVVEHEDEPVAARPARPVRKKGRASVPSWDEIMFGGGDSSS